MLPLFSFGVKVSFYELNNSPSPHSLKQSHRDLVKLPRLNDCVGGGCTKGIEDNLRMG